MHVVGRPRGQKHDRAAEIVRGRPSVPPESGRGSAGSAPDPRRARACCRCENSPARWRSRSRLFQPTRSRAPWSTARRRLWPPHTPGTRTPPWNESTDAMLMILPPPAASMCRPAARHSRNTLERFTSITASQSASPYAAASARRMMPALLTRISSRPKRSRTPGTSVSAASRCRRSATRHAVRTPHSDASAAAATSAGSCRARVQRDVGAGLRERARHRRAEPARGAGDERHASGEVKGDGGAAAVGIEATTIICGVAWTAMRGSVADSDLADCR